MSPPMSHPEEDHPARGITRREILAAGAALGVGLTAAGCGRGASSSTVKSAATIAPAGSDLGAVEHVIFLMMENRSFDHYYGTYPGVRGFDDHPADDLGPFSPGLPGEQDRPTCRSTTAVPPRHREHRSGRLHLRSDAQLAPTAPVPKRRANGLVRASPHRA